MYDKEKVLKLAKETLSKIKETNLTVGDTSKNHLAGRLISVLSGCSVLRYQDNQALFKDKKPIDEGADLRSHQKHFYQGPAKSLLKKQRGLFFV